MKLSAVVWGYRKRYYLTHPWKWFKDFWYNLKSVYMRAKYGYCYTDIWCMENWLLEILPPMFRHLADHGCAYPGEEPFNTPEKWHDWLHSVADVLESLQEKNWYSQNEYEEDFHEMSRARRFAKEKNNHITTTMTYNDEDFQMIKELYFSRARELQKERKKLLIDTGHEIFQYLDYLWD